jgi:hypothetical protein
VVQAEGKVVIVNLPSVGSRLQRMASITSRLTPAVLTKTVAQSFWKQLIPCSAGIMRR